MPARTFAIGDVHGCSRALDALIGMLDVRPNDRVILLGDYVDRGPDSRGVLDRLIALGRRCRLVPLLGNHDQMLREARTSERARRAWLDYGGIATLASYGGTLDAIPPEHVAFLEGCRDVFETETHLFVHASYYPELPMDRQPAEVTRWHSLRRSVPGPHRSGKAAVVGHTSQKDGEVLDLGYLTCIDTYCYGGGWLTALEPATGWVVQANGRGARREWRLRPSRD